MANYRYRREIEPGTASVLCPLHHLALVSVAETLALVCNRTFFGRVVVIRHRPSQMKVEGETSCPHIPQLHQTPSAESSSVPFVSHHASLLPPLLSPHFSPSCLQQLSGLSGIWDSSLYCSEHNPRGFVSGAGFC